MKFQSLNPDELDELLARINARTPKDMSVKRDAKQRVQEKRLARAERLKSDRSQASMKQRRLEWFKRATFEALSELGEEEVPVARLLRGAIETEADPDRYEATMIEAVERLGDDHRASRVLRAAMERPESGHA